MFPLFNVLVDPTTSTNGYPSMNVTVLVQGSSNGEEDSSSSSYLLLPNILIIWWVKSAKVGTLAWLPWLNHQELALPSKCSTEISTTSFSTTGCSRKNASSFITQVFAAYSSDPSNLDNRTLFPLIILLLYGLFSSFSWINWGRSRVSLEALGWCLYSSKYWLRISRCKFS